MRACDLGDSKSRESDFVPDWRPDEQTLRVGWTLSWYAGLPEKLMAVATTGSPTRVPLSHGRLRKWRSGGRPTTQETRPMIALSLWMRAFRSIIGRASWLD